MAAAGSGYATPIKKDNVTTTGRNTAGTKNPTAAMPVPSVPSRICARMDGVSRPPIQDPAASASVTIATTRVIRVGRVVPDACTMHVPADAKPRARPREESTASVA
jgi:hypothetical protein